MANVHYRVRLRRDNPEADKLKAAIKAASVVVRQEVLHLTSLMERDLIPSKDRLEILDGWLETYALSLAAGRLRLLCSFDALNVEWNLLALSTGPDFKNEAYREACAAHGLARPSRAP